ncbi:FAD-dependent oxidoreductase [uncultured Dokdonia sp.]|uniref:NAD(P)/FAD-dependent oxidoreductase n=1 Tax=uncultured Dokdonia sp. TaxID=575653 RepID=UPI00262EDB4B|nr:FAD-dependent oxidoreductase [uncultured Dokdonia sp.]
MRDVDYIIVGLGLAGIAFCEQLENAHKEFLVFDSGVDGASRVAAGLYNPVILKRYTLPWKATEQLDIAVPYFKKIEKKIQAQCMQELPVQKVFSSIEDQNNWFAASDKPELERFIATELIPDSNQYIEAPYAYGKVLETGRIDIKLLQQKYQAYLESKNAFAKAEFEHSAIEFTSNGVVYKEVRAKRIVFAEGYGVKKNPYFKQLPLVGNKGEYIIIKAKDLKLTAAIKTSFFVVPLGGDLYKVGATFNWKDKDTEPSKEAREELIEKLASLVSCEYEIVDQEVGIRPTVGDRRALLGIHPEYSELVVFNGLGTRGIMMSAMLAMHLFDHLENGKDLFKEVNISRFGKRKSD